MTRLEHAALLREVYQNMAPRDSAGRIVAPAKFARMSAEAVNEWDFEARHLAQRVAAAIVALESRK